MSNEQYREKENRGPLDTVGTVIGAALAVGAGAALLHSEGGFSKFLGDSNLRRVGKVMNDFLNETSAMEAKDFDLNAMKSLTRKYITDENSIWKTSADEFRNAVYLRNSAPGNIFDAITERIRLQNKPKSILSPLYDTERIKKPLWEEFNKYAKNDFDSYKIQNFVDDAVSNIKKYVLATDTEGEYMPSPEALERHFKDTTISAEDQHDMMMKIIDKVGAEKKANFDAFAEENKNIPIEMSGKILENMRDKFAQKNNFFSGVIDRAATINDVLTHYDANKDLYKNVKESIPNMAKSDEPYSMENKIQLLREFVEKNSDLGNLVVDADYLKVNKNGEVYSVGALKDVQKKFADEFANTIPGKLVKAREFLAPQEAPNFMLQTGRIFDPILAHMEGKGKTAIENSYIDIMGKTYRINMDGTQSLTHISELDNSYLTMGEHGMFSRLLKMMTGDSDRGHLPNNKVLGWLDVFSSGSPTALDTWRGVAHKFNDPKWVRNIVDNLVTNGQKLTNIAEAYNGHVDRMIHAANETEKEMHAALAVTHEKAINEYFENIKALNQWMAKVTSPLDKKAVNRLAGLGSVSNSHIFGMLRHEDDELLHSFTEYYINASNKKTLKNNDLISLMDRYLNNKSKVVNNFTTASDHNMFGPNVTKVDFMKMLKKEIAKEGFLQEASSRQSGAIFSMIEKAGLTGESRLRAEELGVWASMQNATNTFMSGHGLQHTLNIKDKADFLIHFQSMISTNETGIFRDQNKAFVEGFKRMSQNHTSIFETGRMPEDANFIPGNRYGQWIHMNKSKSIISVLNGDITAKAYGKQFTAGGKNIGDVTTATMFPYFSLMRLMDPLNKFGIGFSSRSTQDVGQLAANIMLKRVLPVVGVGAAFSYLNDTSRQISGTSLTAAGANTVARFDLGMRRISDATGITNWMKAHRDASVMSQYLHNDDDYQSYDERMQWYRDGYTDVRKGRWWSFGSTQEWRGGKIDYYQPNYLIRAQNSEWYDASVYGSSSEKWAHSWIPTPTHPLSTLRRLADPYWLERKHYWDRPYPMSGKMFGEGAPWSGVLNATVGELLKPQKRMHQSELGNSLLDVRDLIARRNQEILNKSANKQLVRIDNTGATAPVSFIPYGHSSNGRMTERLQIQGGSITSQALGSSPDNGLSYQADDFGGYLQDTYGGIGMSMPGMGGGSGAPKLSVTGVIRNTPVVSEIFNSYLKATKGVKGQLAQMNMNIHGRAAKQPQGMIVPDAIYKESARMSKDVLYNKEAMADLRSIGMNKDNLSDSLYSAKQLLGMYGFAMETLLPGKRQYRLAQANTMTSFSRRFWSNDLGGWGGEVMEIARRFFPHENHALQDINPIRNTMPDWMPERFLHGDPYAAIPKGEMRLPGAGYEKMYKLHSDQFGRYGAYDRMKILGDIAPYSQEYKVWRDIATKTVMDPALKNSMKAIRKRVANQSKTHDFYDYRFINNGIEKHNATISKVISNNTFMIAGDDNRIFKLAGISVGRDQDMSKYLQAGMSVTLGIDKNRYKRLNEDGTFNSVVYYNGENLNQELLRAHVATKRSDDITGAGIVARTSTSGIMTGSLGELVAHADIPFLHDKFMRVETPLESYKRHHVYGNEYSTWSHPIKSMLMPEMNRMWSQGLAYQALAYSAFKLSKNVAANAEASKLLKVSVNVARGLVNRGDFIGSGMLKMIRPNSQIYKSLAGDAITMVGFAGYAATRLNNPIASTFNFGLIGAKLGKQLIHDTKKGALIGAAVGLGMSAVTTSGFNKTRLFQPWIPKKTRKQWETEEYFDRLKYIKYMGLYQKATRKALIFEHQNIDHLLNSMERANDKNQKIKNKLLAKKEKLSNSLTEGSAEALNEIDKALAGTYSQEKILRAGKWTRAALAYRQAAESTMYGLKSNATWAQVLRALPRQDRDYVLEFAKEKDPKKRKKIEKYFSPYERRVLHTLWGEKVKKAESNTSFFARHQLPGPFWAGWKPDVDLDSVEIKAIKNEGLMLSDFGFYESELESPETKNAPTIDIHQQQSSIAIKKNLLAALHGSGLVGVNVSVEPSNAKGIQLIANIARMQQYDLKQRVTNAIGSIF